MVHIDLAKIFGSCFSPHIPSTSVSLRLAEALVNGISLCYRGYSIRLPVNNFFSMAIPVHSSVRKGYPLSLLLFALNLEPLCRSALRRPFVDFVCNR